MTKLRFFSLVLFFLFSLTANAQIKYGIKVGLSSYDLADDFLEWNNSDKKATRIITDASYGYHFGGFVRVKVGGIYVEPALLFNSNNVSYNFSDSGASTLLSSVKEETYKSLDIPVLVGTKIWFFNAHIGPVAHLFIDSGSDLTSLSKFKKKWSDARFGYQAGIGFSLSDIRLEFNYEGNFSSFGRELNIGGTSLTMDDNAARIVASISYAF